MAQQYNTLQEIRSSGKQPILPFEETTLRARLDELGVRQRDLGHLLGEVMDQSSETWHDNHAAEMIAADSRGLGDEAEKIIRTLQTAYVASYGSVEPEVPGGATLGSIVDIEFSPGDTVSMLLTGAISELPEDITVYYPGMEATTISSPLGAAVLNAQSGAEVTFEINQRSMGVKVGQIAVFGDMTQTG
ncbi:MAG TPA: hypothetical protein VJR27_01210 [Candidatus Saccharimonadales bacterium]|nr:hypothetical protein [Candidatus Saccharimonadales bacterium]